MKKIRLIGLLYLYCFNIITYNMEQDNKNIFPEKTSLVANDIDNLVIMGIKHIQNNGEAFKARAGCGIQAYDVDYTLTNPLNRVHNLRFC